MPDRDLSRGDPNDVRFQYEVIKQLAESVRQNSESTRQQSTVMADIQKTQVGMLERLARIEANRINEDVARLEQRVSGLADKVDRLEAERDVRSGAFSVFDWLRVWGPVLFSFLAAVWLFGRSLGIVPTPPASPPAALPAAERRTEGK